MSKKAEPNSKPTSSEHQRNPRDWIIKIPIKSKIFPGITHLQEVDLFCYEKLPAQKTSITGEIQSKGELKRKN